VLEVLVLGSVDPLFEGKAQCVILPGEEGVFEVQPFHRPLVSRLLPGVVLVDKQAFPIQSGIVKVGRNKVLAIVDSRPSA